jgi:hypothetical protein
MSAMFSYINWAGGNRQLRRGACKKILNAYCDFVWKESENEGYDKV